MADDSYLSAKAAAELLGVSVATIYSYVSRGWLRSIEGDDARQTKRRRYAREDVEALRQRQVLKRTPRAAVEGALHWGIPALESSISTIKDGRLYYRGYDAVELAERATFEEVAGLLLTGRLDGSLLSEDVELPPEGDLSHELPHLVRMSMDMAQCTEAFIGHDPETAAKLIRRLFAITGSRRSLLAEGLSLNWAAWPGSASWINSVLILLADHELNVSSFTARCIASTGAGLPACISGGLAALSGPKHGGATTRVFEFLATISDARNVPDAIETRLGEGEAIPGFGHPLYPAGDPRAAALLKRSARAQTIPEAVQSYMEEKYGLQPNVDFALAARCCGGGRRPAFASALFALARSVGWCAHALEQFEQGTLIRPRATYTGSMSGSNYC